LDFGGMTGSIPALIRASRTRLASNARPASNCRQDRPSISAAGRRSLRLALLRLLSRLDGGARAAAAFRAADNMTDLVGALGCLLEIGQGQAELAAFEAQWGQDRLVMDKFLMRTEGRHLKANETVHHKDGNKQNNHYSNLSNRCP
jgi:hypothetical protein